MSLNKVRVFWMFSVTKRIPFFRDLPNISITPKIKYILDINSESSKAQADGGLLLLEVADCFVK